MKLIATILGVQIANYYRSRNRSRFSVTGFCYRNQYVDVHCVTGGLTLMLFAEIIGWRDMLNPERKIFRSAHVERFRRFVCAISA